MSARDIAELDLGKLSGSLGAILTDALAGRSPLLRAIVAEGQAAVAPILEGAEEDIREFGLLIAADMLSARIRGDEAWMAELRAQVVTLAERTRVRVDVARWAFAESVFEMLFRAALAAVGAAKAAGVGG